MSEHTGRLLAEIGDLLAIHYDTLAVEGEQTPQRALGRYLRACRDCQEFTLSEVAQRSGVSESEILAYEHGLIPPNAIKADTLRALAYALGEELDAFLLFLEADLVHQPDLRPDQPDPLWFAGKLADLRHLSLRHLSLPVMLALTILSLSFHFTSSSQPKVVDTPQTQQSALPVALASTLVPEAIEIQVGADTLYISGDFNHWQPQEGTHDPDRWSLSIDLAESTVFSSELPILQTSAGQQVRLIVAVEPVSIEVTPGAIDAVSSASGSFLDPKTVATTTNWPTEGELADHIRSGALTPPGVAAQVKVEPERTMPATQVIASLPAGREVAATPVIESVESAEPLLHTIGAGEGFECIGEKYYVKKKLYPLICHYNFPGQECSTIILRTGDQLAIPTLEDFNAQGQLLPQLLQELRIEEDVMPWLTSASVHARQAARRGEAYFCQDDDYARFNTVAVVTNLPRASAP